MGGLAMKIWTLVAVFGMLGSSFGPEAQAEDYSQYQCGKTGKVLVCHKNPAGEHVISVSSNAVKAHLAHGDSLGRCEGTTYQDLKKKCGICDADIDECPSE